MSGQGRGSSNLIGIEASELLAQLLERLVHARKYKPARLAKGKEWVIIYYVHHPVTGSWVRKREKLNHIKDKAERERFSARRLSELNAALALGWTPFRHGNGAITAPNLVHCLKEFLEAKVRERIRPDSYRSYSSNINLLIQWLVHNGYGEMDVLGFTDQVAKTFMNQSYVDRELGARTFNNYHTFYVTVWNWLKDHNYCSVNVFHSVKKKKLDPEASRHRPPTIQERQAIRNYLKAENPRFFTFCLLCFHCGIRPKEIFMLKPEHFHLESDHIIVPGYVAKNHRTQGVAIPAVLKPELEALELDKQRKEHYVFSTNFEPGHRRCDSRDSGRAWVRLREAIKLPREVTLYQLKHAGGEQLSRDGLSEVDLMNHLRHHDLSETSTYTRRTYEYGVRDVLKKATPF